MRKSLKALGSRLIATVTLNPSLDEWIELEGLRVGELNRAHQFQRYPGGKGINVSRVIHELGGRTCAFGLNGGADGAILRDLLRRMRIPHDFVAIKGTTRNNYKIRTRSPRALTEINTDGPRIPHTVLATLLLRLFTRRTPPRAVALSGSLPPGAAPRVYRTWIGRLQQRRIPAALDASGAALREGLAARPWLVKPNRAEAEELLGRQLGSLGQTAEAACALTRRGASLAILSLGAEGAVLAQAASTAVWYARPPKVVVDSAVGAGDSLVGGFLHGWVHSGDVLEAFRLGVACGTATAMTPGTELCHRRDVLRLAPRVRLQRLA